MAEKTLHITQPSYAPTKLDELGHPQHIKSKLTPYTHNLLVAAVGKGLTLAMAANAAGISLKTLNRWMEQGEEEDGTIFSNLVVDLQQAEAKYFAQKLEELDRLADNANDWRGKLAILERRFPEDFSKQSGSKNQNGPSTVVPTINILLDDRPLNAPQLSGPDDTEDADFTEITPDEDV